MKILTKLPEKLPKSKRVPHTKEEILRLTAEVKKVIEKELEYAKKARQDSYNPNF